MVTTFNDVYDFNRDSILGCDVPQGLSVNAIKSFAEVDKVHQNWFLSCQAFIDNLSQSEDLLTAGTSSPKSCLIRTQNHINE